jgi:polar amino acid transport system substrate-binding protein
VLGLSLAGTLTMFAMSACTSDGTVSSVPDGCKPAHKVDTVKEGVLTVAAVDIAPVSMPKDGAFDGVEADLLEKFAKQNCLALKVDTVSFAAAIPAVQSGRADVATGGFYRTAERSKVVGLSEPLYVDELAAVSADGIANVDDMKGLKVGTVDGYLWVPDAKKAFGSDLTVYPSDVEMKADLEAGRIAVGLDSLGAAQALFGDDFEVVPLAQDDRVGATSEPAQIGFPVTLHNDSLLSALNDAISGWQQDDSIVKALESAGMPASLADVGAPRLLQ